MSKLTLESNRLSVVFSSPGAFYAGSRFDWTGFITDVTLDGRHSFCVDESLIPGVGTGGRGLCNEFGIHEPIGYDEAQVGEYFPKLGVGLLKRRSAEEYRFWEPYEITPAPVEIISQNDCISFLSSYPECNGYGASLRKDFTVKDNLMKVEYTLTNLGKKDLSTTEYIHNFVNIDGKGVGPHSLLSFSFTLQGDNIPDVFQVSENSIKFKEVPDKEFYWAPKGYEGKPTCSWSLIDQQTGVGLKETCDFQALRVGIWGKAHVVSPELFIGLKVAPGETKRWTRSYEFFTS